MTAFTFKLKKQPNNTLKLFLSYDVATCGHFLPKFGVLGPALMGFKWAKLCAYDVNVTSYFLAISTAQPCGHFFGISLPIL